MVILNINGTKKKKIFFGNFKIVGSVHRRIGGGGVCRVKQC